MYHVQVILPWHAISRHSCTEAGEDARAPEAGHGQLEGTLAYRGPGVIRYLAKYANSSSVDRNTRLQ